MPWGQKQKMYENNGIDKDNDDPAEESPDDPKLLLEIDVEVNILGTMYRFYISLFPVSFPSNWFPQMRKTQATMIIKVLPAVPEKGKPCQIEANESIEVSLTGGNGEMRSLKAAVPEHFINTFGVIGILIEFLAKWLILGTD